MTKMDTDSVMNMDFLLRRRPKGFRPSSEAGPKSRRPEMKEKIHVHHASAESKAPNDGNGDGNGDGDGNGNGALRFRTRRSYHPPPCTISSPPPPCSRPAASSWS